MRPHLYPTPFRQHWAPPMARLYHGLLPDRMDDLTHAELRAVFADIEALAS